MFFKKTIIKNHVSYLSSCDVVTFAVRIATVSNLRMHNKHLKNLVFTLKMNAIKQLKVKSYQKPVGLAQDFYSSFGRRTQQDLLSDHFALTDKTWTNARNSQLSTCLKDIA